MTNFWQKLKKRERQGEPILALAPMAGLTDSAFRQICKKFGADVVYSEMASVEALCHNPQKTLKMLEFSKSERPYVVQLFGANPDHFAKAVKIVEKQIKPDGIDINFGCPVKKVQKQGAGAVLMDNLKLAREIIKTAINNTKLPISIKTRSQVGQTDVLEFLDYIKDLDVKCVMIHGRKLSQGHSGPVNWQIIKQARNYFGGIILANGGVMTAKDGQRLLEKAQADGLGIARGALGKPWIFEEIKSLQPLRLVSDLLRTRESEASESRRALSLQKGGPACYASQASMAGGQALQSLPIGRQGGQARGSKEIFKIMIQHARLAEKIKGRRGIVEMRKHLCWYVKGFAGASEIRQELVRAKSFKEIEKILMDIDEY